MLIVATLFIFINVQYDYEFTVNKIGIVSKLKKKNPDMFCLQDPNYGRSCRLSSNMSYMTKGVKN